MTGQQLMTGHQLRGMPTRLRAWWDAEAPRPDGKTEIKNTDRGFCTIAIGEQPEVFKRYGIPHWDAGSGQCRGSDRDSRRNGRP